MGAALEQDPVSRRPRDRREEHGRGADDHGARRGDDQHHHGVVERIGEPLSVQEPGADEDEHGGEQHARDVRAAPRLDEQLRPGLRGLGVTDQADDPLQRGVGDRPGHADQDGLPRPLIVPAKTGLPTTLDTGSLSPVNVASSAQVSPSDHLAIDGESLAGPDPDQVADAQGFDPDAGLDAVADQASLPGPEPDERVDRPGGPVHGIRFEGVAQREQEEQDGPLTPVAQDRGPDRRQDHEQVDGEPQSPQLGDRRDGRHRPPGDVGDDEQHERHISRSHRPPGQPECGAEDGRYRRRERRGFPGRAGLPGRASRRGGVGR